MSTLLIGSYCNYIQNDIIVHVQLTQNITKKNLNNWIKENDGSNQTVIDLKKIYICYAVYWSKRMASKLPVVINWSIYVGCFKD